MDNKHQVLTSDTSFPHPSLPTYVRSSTELCAPYWSHYPPSRIIYRQLCKRYSYLPRGVFRPRQSRQLPRAVDLKGRLLSCQSY